MSWICATCGKSHEDIPLSFAADFPDNYAYMPEDERKHRAIANADQCVIDGKEFYVRGCLEIALHDSKEIFLWGLWASVSRECFSEMIDCREERGREKHHGPFNGWLGNSLKVYSPETFNLRLSIKLSPVGERPLFIVEAPEHPLGIAQRNGMSNEQVQDLLSALMH